MVVGSEGRDERSRSRWLTLFGTVEGILAACLTVIVFLLPVSSGSQRQMTILMIGLIGLGLGLGVSGVRFGEGSVRSAAWFAVIVLSLLCAVLAVRSFCL